MISSLTKNETTQFIDGPVGKLELAVEEQAEEKRGAWGIVCHPHSLYGGTMQNKVVTTAVKAFQNLGLNTVRFNFRGVGESAGVYDHGRGELQDLLTVVDWVRKERPFHDIWLAGFSFGAYVAAQAATKIEPKKLVTIAPPVEHFPMQDIPSITCPWVLVQGDKDEVVPPHLVYAWIETRDPKPTVIRFPEAGHFFHGQLTELRLKLEEALR